MIYRLEYRAFLKEKFDETEFEASLKALEGKLQKRIEEGTLLQVCIYRHERMLFAYIEALTEGTTAEELFSEIKTNLEPQPSENGSRTWAYMNPIYFQSIPDTAEDWIKDRGPGKTKVGRIAWLKPETMFDYVYWHKAITDEGLLKGDRYQFISLHENMLFSYYEEPRTNVNISGVEGESEAIKGWLAIDPGAHFDLIKTGGPHFKVLPSILTVRKV